MRSDLFYWVLNMSIIGSLAGLVVLLFRRVKRLPRFAVCLLWAVPLLRLWLPFGAASEYSLMNLLAQFGTKTVVVWEPGEWLDSGISAFGFSAVNSVRAAQEYFPVVYKSDLLAGIFQTAALVWILVVGSLLLCAGFLYLSAKRSLKSAEHITGKVYRSAQLKSPAVYGILRPKILLPETVLQEDIESILRHERAHIRRLDNLWRALAVVTVCVHWFNPLAWIFLRCFLADAELACDARALRGLDAAGKKQYAGALLSAAAGKGLFASPFGGAKITRRIESIVSYKRLTLSAALASAALVAAVAYVLLTNAK